MNADLDGVSFHERVHALACRGERLPVRWTPRGDELVVESLVPWGRAGTARAAVALAAGAMAGGGDEAGDWVAAQGLAREAGWSWDEVQARAARYVQAAR